MKLTVVLISVAVLATGAAVAGWTEMTPMPLGREDSGVTRGGWLVPVDTDSGLFIYATKGEYTTQLYRYNVDSGEWTSCASMPRDSGGKPMGDGSAAVYDGRRFIYATKGNFTFELWRYDVLRDMWERMLDVPLGINRKSVRKGTDMACAEVAGTLHVYLLKGYRNEFYRFNTADGLWDDLDFAPVGQRNYWVNGSWLAFDGVWGLYAQKGQYNELWRYRIDIDEWDTEQLSGMPFAGGGGVSVAASGGDGAWCDGLMYAVKGAPDYLSQELWRYDPGNDSWAELDTIPRTGSSGDSVGFAHGSDIVSVGEGVFYATKGGGTREFWRYVAPAGVGETKPGCDRAKLPATLVCQHFTLAGPNGGILVDIRGRRVMSLQPGENDIRHLAPGVYFAREEEPRGQGSQGPSVRKVVVQR